MDAIFKLYCIVSKEALQKMKGVRGKMIAQGGHAFLHAYWDSVARFPEYAKSYQSSDHAFKVTLVVDTDKELEDLVNHYREICGVTLVKDAGFTVFNEPTVTCAGIGPIRSDMVEPNLSSLRTLT
jgi:peptidyl-tRNA hydrolase